MTRTFDDHCEAVFAAVVSGVGGLASRHRQRVVRPKRMGSWPMLKAREASLWDPIPIGRDLQTGDLVDIRLVGGHMLVGGESGGGKSVFMSMICAAAALDPNAKLWLLDAKELELAVWAPVAERFVGDDLGDAVSVLTDVRATLNVRKRELLDQAAREGRPVRKIRRELGLPLHVVVIDELAEYTEGRDKKGAEFSSLLRSIVSLGRATGIIVIAATQKAQANIVPSELRDLFKYRIAFRCAVWQMSDTILGSGWASAGSSAAKIPSESPGQGLLLAEGAHPRPIQTFNLTDDNLAMLAARAKALRGKEGILCTT